MSPISEIKKRQDEPRLAQFDLVSKRTNMVRRASEVWRAAPLGAVQWKSRENSGQRPPVPRPAGGLDLAGSVGNPAARTRYRARCGMRRSTLQIPVIAGGDLYGHRHYRLGGSFRIRSSRYTLLQRDDLAGRRRVRRFHSLHRDNGTRSGFSGYDWPDVPMSRAGWNALAHRPLCRAMAFHPLRLLALHSVRPRSLVGVGRICEPAGIRSGQRCDCGVLQSHGSVASPGRATDSIGAGASWSAYPLLTVCAAATGPRHSSQHFDARPRWGRLPWIYSPGREARSWLTF